MTGQTHSFFMSLLRQPTLFVDAPMPEVLDADTIGEFLTLSVLVDRELEGGDEVAVLARTLSLVEQGITGEREDLAAQLREAANRLADFQLGSPVLYQALVESAATAFKARDSFQAVERWA